MSNEVVDREDNATEQLPPRRGGKKADPSDIFNKLINVPLCVKYKNVLFAIKQKPNPDKKTLQRNAKLPPNQQFHCTLCDENDLYKAPTNLEVKFNTYSKLTSQDMEDAIFQRPNKVYTNFNDLMTVIKREQTEYQRFLKALNPKFVAVKQSLPYGYTGAASEYYRILSNFYYDKKKSYRIFTTHDLSAISSHSTVYNFERFGQVISYGVPIKVRTPKLDSSFSCDIKPHIHRHLSSYLKMRKPITIRKPKTDPVYSASQEKATSIDQDKCKCPVEISLAKTRDEVETEDTRVKTAENVKSGSVATKSDEARREDNYAPQTNDAANDDNESTAITEICVSNVTEKADKDDFELKPVEMDDQNELMETSVCMDKVVHSSGVVAVNDESEKSNVDVPQFSEGLKNAIGIVNTDCDKTDSEVEIPENVVENDRSTFKERTETKNQLMSSSEEKAEILSTKVDPVIEPIALPQVNAALYKHIHVPVSLDLDLFITDVPINRLGNYTEDYCNYPMLIDFLSSLKIAEVVCDMESLLYVFSTTAPSFFRTFQFYIDVTIQDDKSKYYKISPPLPSTDVLPEVLKADFLNICYRETQSRAQQKQPESPNVQLMEYLTVSGAIFHDKEHGRNACEQLQKFNDPMKTVSFVEWKNLNSNVIENKFFSLFGFKETNFIVAGDQPYHTKFMGNMENVIIYIKPQYFYEYGFEILTESELAYIYLKTLLSDCIGAVIIYYDPNTDKILNMQEKLLEDFSVTSFSSCFNRLNSFFEMLQSLNEGQHLYKHENNRSKSFVYHELDESSPLLPDIKLTPLQNPTISHLVTPTEFDKSLMTPWQRHSLRLPLCFCPRIPGTYICHEYLPRNQCSKFSTCTFAHLTKAQLEAELGPENYSEFMTEFNKPKEEKCKQSDRKRSMPSSAGKKRRRSKRKKLA